ncbi:conserved repeat domain protein [Isosphaera pallida ATCC 43644]|uniref:Conserved repeat domain protein n=1 Tax=Isosphaera pallida (strain ATCC 43644 / DSM 9630 / IS1B) TaxID=575540 RepID=E8R3L4_ISOPI|nr:SdrD B-like domain-containing protein [Isosphaera pallida]ADV61581.1 conserved repeat domain protein [Isosphaera pallida ATCC 43644]
MSPPLEPTSNCVASSIRARRGLRDRLRNRPSSSARVRPETSALVWTLEPRIAPAAQPSAALIDLPPYALLNQRFEFGVEVANLSPISPGYRPFVDLTLPDYASYEGLSLDQARVLGTPITPLTRVFDSTGYAPHPLATDSQGQPLMVRGQPGHLLVTLPLPTTALSGSSQPWRVEVDARVGPRAIPGQPLVVTARAGFALGNDPLDNPAFDPPILQNNPTVSSIEPRLFVVSTRLEHLDGTPIVSPLPGPNHAFDLVQTITVAPGLDLFDLTFQTRLDPSTRWRRVFDPLVNGIPTPTAFTTGSDGGVTGVLPSVVAPNATTSSVVEWRSRLELDPFTAEASTWWMDFESHASARPFGGFVTDQTRVGEGDQAGPIDMVRLERSQPRWIEDRGPAGLSPGDRLEWQMRFDLADLAAFDQARLEIHLPDGLQLDPTFTPTLTWFDPLGAITEQPFEPPHWSLDSRRVGFTPSVAPDGTDGVTELTFRFSDQLAAWRQAHDGGERLLGGHTGGFKNDASHGWVRLRTVVREGPTDGHPDRPILDQNQTLPIYTRWTARPLALDDFTPLHQARLELERISPVATAPGQIATDLITLNEVPIPPSGFTLRQGDLATHRVRIELPTGRTNGLTIRLELPDLIHPGDGTSFDGRPAPFFEPIGSHGPLNAGGVRFGPNDQWAERAGTVPQLDFEPTRNTIHLHFPAWQPGTSNLNGPHDQPLTIELLVPLRVANAPSWWVDTQAWTLGVSAIQADGTALVSTRGTDAAAAEDSITALNTPAFDPPRLWLGAVAVNSPGFLTSPPPVSFTPPGSVGNRFSATLSSQSLTVNPLVASAQRIGRGNLVTLALAVENIANVGDGLFETLVRVERPAGTEIPTTGPGLNLRVVDGTGAAIPFVAVGNGLFDPNGGLRLLDPGPTAGAGANGAVDRFNLTSGRNIAVILFDLAIAQDAPLGVPLVMRGILEDYAETAGGASQLPGAANLTSSILLLPDYVDPVVFPVATSEAHTIGTEVAIGEVVRFRTVVPLGTTIPNLQVQFALPNGLSYLPGDTTRVAVVSNLPNGVTLANLPAQPGLHVVGDEFNAISIQPSIPLPTNLVSVTGNLVSFNLGSINNTENDPNLEFLVFEFNLVVANRTGVVAGSSPSFQVIARPNNVQTFNSLLTTLNVVEGELAPPAVAPSKPRPAPNETFQFVSSFTHPGGSREVFDVQFVQTLDPGLTDLAIVNLTGTGSAVPIGQIVGSSLIVTVPLMAPGATVNVTLSARVEETVLNNTVLAAQSVLTWTSLPGPNGTVSNPTGSATPGAPGSTTGERIGTPDPNDPNTYRLTRTDTVRVRAIPGLFKTVEATNLPDSATSGTDVTVGEQVTYRLRIQVPEAYDGIVTLTDLLPPGLTIVAIDSITASPTVATNRPGGFAAILTEANANLAAPGQTFTLNLGDLTNSDLVVGTPEFLDILYRATVLNVAGNQAGTLIGGGQVALTIDGDPGPVASGPTLRVVEPSLTLTLATPRVLVPPGGQVPLIVTLAHPGGAAVSPAYDALIDLTTTLPGLTILPNSLTMLGGVASSTAQFLNGGALVGVDRLNPGEFSQFQVLAQVAVDAPLNAPLDFNGVLTWTSLPENGVSPPGSVVSSPFNPAAIERSGNPNAPGGALNDYRALAGTTITVQPASLTGRVFQDDNGNELFDPGEPGLAGVVLTLSGIDIAGQNVLRQAITNANGIYVFDNLRPALGAGYQIVQTQPVGFADGPARVGSLGGQADQPNRVFGILINPLDTSPGALDGVGYDFAEYPFSSLSGRVFLDLNRDGQRQPNEPGLPGVLMELDGIDRFGRPVTAAVTTDPNGVYEFLNLPPGTFRIRQPIQPPDYFDGGVIVGSLGGVAGFNQITQIVVPPGPANAGINYDFAEQLKFKITGRVYVDADANDLFSPGEPGLPGVLMRLVGLDAFGQSIDLVAVTDAEGVFLFENLAPAATNSPGYSLIQVVQPSGFFDASLSIGTFGGVAGNNRIDGIRPDGLLGDVGVGYDFGEFGASTLVGRHYLDANGNGVFDPGEPPLANVQTTLSGVDYRGNPLTLTILSDANGLFEFLNLPPSNPNGYTLTQTQPAGLFDGEVTVGSLGGLPSFNQVQAIVVPRGAGVNATGYAFGEFGPSRIQGRHYLDANGNGVFDPGEPPLANVQTTLSGVDYRGNPLTLTILSDANGLFEFLNLPPSNPNGYTLTQTQPAGLFDGEVTVGSLGGLPSFNQVQAIVVPRGAGVNATGYAFGEFGPSRIQGRHYLDANGNGVFDPGEPPLANVQTTLSGVDYRGNPLTLTILSDANGLFEFLNLPPSNPNGYTLTQITPVGRFPSEARVGLFGGVADFGRVTQLVVPRGGGSLGSGYDLGVFGSSSLSGRVFLDNNGDELFGPGDQPIADVILSLLGVDYRGRTVLLLAATDSQGRFRFENLPPSLTGSGYTLRQTQPAGVFDGPVVVGSLGGVAATNRVDQIAVPRGAGVEGVGYNFTEFNQAAFGGRVFIDLDGDGRFSPGIDEPLEGVTLRLTGVDRQGRNVLRTVVTNVDGLYGFGALPPSDSNGYTIQELLDEETREVFNGPIQVGGLGGVVDLANERVQGIIFLPGAGEGGFGYDFVHFAPGSLAGRVLIDADASGQASASDLGVAGVTLTLSGRDYLNNPVSRTVVTDAEGQFVLAGLPPSSAAGYTLSQTQPSGLLDGPALVGTRGGVALANRFEGIVLRPGFRDDADNYFFLEYRPSSITGLVYDDANNTGQFDQGDAPIAGVTLRLTGFDVSGRLIQRETVTNAQGLFRFDNLLPVNPGDDPSRWYRLEQIQPPGFAQGTNRVGSAGGLIEGDVISRIALGENQAAVNYQFGERRQVDVGVALAVDRPFPRRGEQVEIIVTLTNAGNRSAQGVETLVQLPEGLVLVPGTIQTSRGGFDPSTGLWFLGDLPGGAATLRFQARVVDSGPFEVVAHVVRTLTPDVNPSNDRATAEIVPVSNLSGQVFLDRNRNGVFDPNVDAPISGVTLRLAGGQLAEPLTAITDGEGRYRFADLLPGRYRIEQLQPDNFRDGSVVIGSVGGEAGVNLIGNINLPAGTDATGYDFAELGLGILGQVFLDRNRDQNRQPNEEGVGQLTVLLFGPQGNFIERVQTDPLGRFLFENLEAGTYRVELQAFGYGLSTPGMIEVTLASNFDAAALNFGVTLAELSLRVFDDRNHDGLFHAPTEFGIAGVEFRLSASFGQSGFEPRTAFSDANGVVRFEDLPAGFYIVEQVQPTGFLDGRINPGAGVIRFTTDARGNNRLEFEVGGGVILDDTTLAELTPARLQGRLIQTDLTSHDDPEGDQDQPIQVTTGLANIPIRLEGIDDRGSAVLLTTLTDTQGHFEFLDLRPSVGLTLFRGQVSKDLFEQPPIVGSLQGQAVGFDRIEAIRLHPADDGRDYLFRTTTGTVVGAVVQLVRQPLAAPPTNQTDNPGELPSAPLVNAPVPGLTIRLTDDTGTRLDEVTTDSQGQFRFLKVPRRNLLQVTLDPIQLAQLGFLIPTDIARNLPLVKIDGVDQPNYRIDPFQLEQPVVTEEPTANDTAPLPRNELDLPPPPTTDSTPNQSPINLAAASGFLSGFFNVNTGIGFNSRGLDNRFAISNSATTSVSTGSSVATTTAASASGSTSTITELVNQAIESATTSGNINAGSVPNTPAQPDEQLDELTRDLLSLAENRQVNELSKTESLDLELVGQMYERSGERIEPSLDDRSNPLDALVADLSLLPRFESPSSIPAATPPPRPTVERSLNGLGTVADQRDPNPPQGLIDLLDLDAALKDAARALREVPATPPTASPRAQGGGPASTNPDAAEAFDAPTSPTNAEVSLLGSVAGTVVGSAALVGFRRVGTPRRPHHHPRPLKRVRF